MQEEYIIHKIAISFLNGLPIEIVKSLPEKGISPKDLFDLNSLDVAHALNLPPRISVANLGRENALEKAKDHWDKMQRHHISPLFINDDDYPFRLSQIPDSPIILYVLGNANLNSEHIISMVGTRRPTPYGVNFCDSIVEDLKGYFPDIVVASGLAYGIDASAHKAALKHNASTVAVVAHGLDMIYPASNRGLATEIIKNGGSIVSEYPFGERPYRQRFLERNRIIAAIADVTMVIESDIKGGAMSTANTAFSYSRDVLALPGRISDETSRGCLHLIRNQKANVVTCAADIIDTTAWKPLNLHVNAKQRNLFPTLDGDMKVMYDLLRFNSEPMQLDKICQLTQIPVAKVVSYLGEMEFDGIIIRHPGNRFSIA